MHPHAAEIIKLLAITDATWEPLRHQHRNQNVSEARNRGGIPWIGGGDEAARQSSHRRLEELEAAGLVTVQRSKGKRAPVVQLTDDADWVARSLADGPRIEDTLATMRRVAAAVENEDHADGFVPEWVLTGFTRADSDAVAREKILNFQFDALPAFPRGWMVSWTSTKGHCYYVLMPKGRKAMEANLASPAGLPGLDPEAVEIYEKSLLAERDRLDTAKPERPSDIGIVPIPVATMTLRQLKASPYYALLRAKFPDQSDSRLSNPWL